MLTFRQYLIINETYPLVCQIQDYAEFFQGPGTKRKLDKPPLFCIRLSWIVLLESTAVVLLTQELGKLMTNKMRRSKVQVYTSSSIITGYVSYLPNQRLLDFLNGILVGTVRTKEEFFTITEATILDPDSKETMMQSVHINKANIFFVQEIEIDQTERLGKMSERHHYPYISKDVVAIKFYLPSCSLTGKMYYAEGQNPTDVLNSAMRFIPLTDVQIYSFAGLSESGASFVAVNRDQILYVEEIVS